MKLRDFWGWLRPNARLLISGVLAGVAVTLATLQHVLNLWGLPWYWQVVAAAVGGPALGLVLAGLLLPVWDEFRRIPGHRWALFFIPALGISLALACNNRPVPEVGHTLVIQPVLSTAAEQVRVIEVRAAYGSTIELGAFSHLQGWDLSDGVLTARGMHSQALKYAFNGPVGEQIRVSFLTSPPGGKALVALDGHQVLLDLTGPSGNETRARLNTRYFWDDLDAFFLPALTALDVLAMTILLGLLWGAHELALRKSAAEDRRRDARTSHVASILVLLVIATTLHAIAFVIAPLAVLKDSPSYLQGAQHLVRFHNLEGASSYRGPATMFLFAPAMAIFGRNPFGVKLVLHLVALACVPVAYRIGWQLSRQRGLAFLAGLATALMPDLYAYSSLVLSEVPQALFILVLCSLLLSALRTRSPASIVFTLLAGSMGALLRPENLMALTLAMVLLLLDVLISRTRGRGVEATGGSRSHWRQELKVVAVGALLAAVPLLAWSIHNARLHGFFGITDYGGEILYDGWVYWGENSGLSIANRNVGAAATLQAVYPITARQGQPAPTGWSMFYQLLDHGYTESQAFTLLGDAAQQSIAAQPGKAGRILLSKLQSAVEPQLTLPDPFLGPDEKPRLRTYNPQFFEEEAAPLPGIAPLRDWLYDSLSRWYAPVYSVVLAIGLLAIWLAFYRGPFLTWTAAAVIALNSLLLPVVAGMGLWRYLVPGLALTQVLAVVVFGSYLGFASAYLRGGKQLLAHVLRTRSRARGSAI
jgi:hypothetical protein